MMTDPVADMLTRIRNALRVDRQHVDMPSSRLKRDIAGVLQEEGYIRGSEELPTKPSPTLRVSLKYGPEGEQVVVEIRRVSRPGRRVYRSVDELPRVRGGLGMAVVSTSRGVMSDRQARARHLGGEVLCTVW